MTVAEMQPPPSNAQDASDKVARLSIVIPAYNSAAWLQRSVRSAYSVQPGPLDVIVVDDGSTDDTPAVLANLRRDFPSLRVFSQVNRGLSAARNAGIRQAYGEYVLFLDADDELISCELGAVLAERPDVLRIGVEEVRVGGETHLHAESRAACNGAEYFAQCALRRSFYTPSWAYVFRRDYLTKRDLRFAHGLSHEDMLFSVQALLAAEHFIAVPTPVYRYLRREQSITTTVTGAHLEKRVRSLDKILRELLRTATRQRAEGVGWWALHVLDYAHRLSSQCPWRRTRARVLGMACLLAAYSVPMRELGWKTDIRWRLWRALRNTLVVVH